MEVEFMKKEYRLAVVALIFSIILFFGCAGKGDKSMIEETRKAKEGQWKGVHFLAPGHGEMQSLMRAIDQVMAPMGVNVVIFEVNYGYEYESHPELRTHNCLTRKEIKNLVSVCRKNDIRLIPMFNCLGHQSWAKTTFPLLKKYPEFDETPDIPPDNPDIYCRSWCPQHPEVNDIVFDLMGELIEVFEAGAFHVGMDEVFLIAHEECPRCKGENPAKLFAGAVNDYHDFLVKKKGLTMLMWGDRLIDSEEMNYSRWEASANGTAPAIDMIPKDIIICDWHYEKQDEYLSVPYFQEKGFRVWPSSWKNVEAAVALMEYSRKHDQGKVIGHLCTTWYSADETAKQMLGKTVESEHAEESLKVIRAMKKCMEMLNRNERLTK